MVCIFLSEFKCSISLLLNFSYIYLSYFIVRKVSHKIISSRVKLSYFHTFHY